MLLDLSDDQELFGETTARLLAELAPPGRLRERRDDPAGFDAAEWRRGAELGWTSLLVDEARGGGSISGHGLVDLTLVATEFGARAAAGPLVGTNLVAAALGAGGVGSRGEHGDVLADLMSGASVATWCDPGEGPPGAGVAIAIDGEQLVLDGAVRPVESGAHADHLLVVGSGPSGPSLVLVPADAPGVSATPLHTVDLTRRFASVAFDAVRVPVASVVGELGAAADVVARLRRVAVVLVVAESVGAMRAAFDMTLEWTFDRYSFGRPLASYQAVKHRMADAATWLEAAHAIGDEAAWAVATDAPEAAELASAAKAFVGEQGSELMQECVQLHGGIGVTFEHDLHLPFRRHTVDRAWFGPPEVHRRHLADLLEAKAVTS